MIESFSDLYTSHRLELRGPRFPWQRSPIWLHVAFASLIALSYLIPTPLISLLGRLRDPAFSRTFAMLSAFVIASGATDLMRFWTFSAPAYWFGEGIKAITGGLPA